MRGASSVYRRSVSTAPFGGQSVDTRSVPVAHAAALIRNFLVALEADGGPNTAFMNFAKARAERELALWGEGGAA